MKDWRNTRHGTKLVSIKLGGAFEPGAALHINPRPDCPLCVLNNPPAVVASIHSSRYGGDSYRMLIEQYHELCKRDGIELNMDLLVRHFSEHFVMRKR